MKTRLYRLVFLFTLIIFSSSLAKDLSGKWIFSPSLGYDYFSILNKKNRDFYKDNFEVGIKFEKFFTKSISAELSYNLAITEINYGKSYWKSKKVAIYDAKVLYNFFYSAEKWMPYIGLGIGSIRGDAGYEVTAGIRYIINHRFALKAEIRDIYLGSGQNDLAPLVALSIMFGGKPEIKDSDNDGVIDSKDLCPHTPRWVLVDNDGCPVDTDKDTVPDYVDQCPDTPEGVEVDVDGCPLDSDGDKVPDYKDKCPDTPEGMKVDENGCPTDTDKDGIPDYKDKCPNTPEGATVDKNGCLIDSDKDGVADNLDQYPNTPEGIEVDEKGCPVDTDKDGVPDYKDKCPNTPEGAVVNEEGCGKDSDNDGVPDYADKCPNTPKDIKVVDKNGCPMDTDKDGIPDYFDKCPDTKPDIPVDKEGCPLDSDKDGIPDYADKCPNTKEGAEVDENGCPKDSDDDGIPDYADKCPNTPEDIMVDEQGCPLDSDNDGIPDFEDKCPNTPEGIEVDEKGCFKSLTLRIYFAPNSTKVDKKYYKEIEKVAKILKQYPSLMIEVQGHTDKRPTSSYEYNMRLSQKRAEAVKRILVKKFGISPDRIVARGYGFTKPIASNDTEEGRAKNRRIEIVVIGDLNKAVK